VTDVVSFGPARDYVRSRVTQEFLNYECRVERVGRPSYDEETLQGTPGTRSTIYEGKCRVWATTASTVIVGDGDVQTEQTMISLPWNIDPLPLRNDEVIITNTPVEDTALEGKRYQIQDYATAGELRPTRRYTVIAMQRSA